MDREPRHQEAPRRPRLTDSAQAIGQIALRQKPRFGCVDVEPPTAGNIDHMGAALCRQLGETGGQAVFAILRRVAQPVEQAAGAVHDARIGTIPVFERLVDRSDGLR